MHLSIAKLTPGTPKRNQPQRHISPADDNERSSLVNVMQPPEARKPAAESGQVKHRLYRDLAAAMSQDEVRRLDDAEHSDMVLSRADAVVRAVRDVL
jgi:hypothetical protein